MKERAAATIVMWGVIALITERLISSIRYTEEVLDPTTSIVISRMATMSGEWQVAVVVMVIFIVMMGALATSFLWDSMNIESQSSHHAEANERKQVEKVKRERRERVARLLETMDDDDLNILEENQFTHDGEIVSMQEMLNERAETARNSRS